LIIFTGIPLFFALLIESTVPTLLLDKKQLIDPIFQ